MNKQFELTRGQLIKFLKETDATLFDDQPKGFNNTLRWHAGHLLVATEGFMFGFPKKSTNLSLSYIELFGMGTRPSNWKHEIPSLEKLIEQLEDQAERVRELPEQFFSKDLPFTFPVGNVETFRDLFGFMLYHEADHLGQMKAMKRILMSRTE
ncbi:DinB family protein [Bacillus pinisoli]|uniref:DinB family protein n=1 Tax=Bacillus pinisoli TaxID=2901866 RepID=UPI001FF3B2C5|nr:DinB family protein [Bacillus pinisoli]